MEVFFLRFEFFPFFHESPLKVEYTLAFEAVANLALLLEVPHIELTGFQICGQRELEIR